jgi:hypothetical protein
MRSRTILSQGTITGPGDKMPLRVKHNILDLKEMQLTKHFITPMST